MPNLMTLLILIRCLSTGKQSLIMVKTPKTMLIDTFFHQFFTVVVTPTSTVSYRSIPADKHMLEFVKAMNSKLGLDVLVSIKEICCGQI